MADVSPALRGYKYIFEVLTSRMITGGFTKVRGLSEEIEVVDKRDGTDPFQIRRIKGTHQGGQVILERGVVQEKREFLTWFQNVKDEVVPYWAHFVVSLNPIQDPSGQQGQPLESYKFFNGWPSRYEVGELDGSASGFALETLALVHEGVRYKFGQQPGAAERREIAGRRVLRPYIPNPK